MEPEDVFEVVGLNRRKVAGFITSMGNLYLAVLTKCEDLDQLMNALQDAKALADKLKKAELSGVLAAEIAKITSECEEAKNILVGLIGNHKPEYYRTTKLGTDLSAVVALWLLEKAGVNGKWRLGEKIVTNLCPDWSAGNNPTQNFRTRYNDVAKYYPKEFLMERWEKFAAEEGDRDPWEYL